MSNDLKPPGVVLEYDTSPSEKASSAVEKLRERWGALYAWGLKTKLPEARKSWESWEAFLSRWDRNDPDVLRVGSQVQTFNRTEAEAAQAGYVVPGPPIEAVGVLEATVAGAAEDTAIGEIEGKISDAEDVANTITGNWGKILIGGAVALGVVGVVGAVISWRAAPYLAPIVTDGLIGFPSRKSEDEQ